MKSKLLLTILGCAAALSGTAHSIELVTNGNFEEGGEIIGASPFGWNTTVKPGSTGQISPSELQSPLSGRVAYLDANPQIAQTFSLGLQPSTTYTIRFDAYLINPDAFPSDTIRVTIAYGSGSGGSSNYAGAIRATDRIGSDTYVDLLTLTARSYSFSFSTPSEINGSPEGSDGTTQRLAIFFDPLVTNALSPERVYLDNVSVTALPVPEPSTAVLTAGFGALLALRRRRPRTVA